MDFMPAMFGLGTSFALLGTFLVLMLLMIFLAVYIYCAVALMFIAKKAKTENGWFAFIPIFNIYLMTQIAGIPAWWTLVIFLPLVPVLGGVAMFASMIYIWWNIAERINRPGWWAILVMIPVVNFVVLGLMAWGK